MFPQLHVCLIAKHIKKRHNEMEFGAFSYNNQKTHDRSYVPKRRRYGARRFECTVCRTLL